jgi:hypothetical protein
MKKIVQFLLEKFGTKLIGSLVTKGLTVASAFLLTKGLMQESQADAWILSNAEVITGAVIGVLSIWLSKKRQDKHQEEKEVAIYSAPPGFKLVPTDEDEETEPKQNFTHR